MTKATICLLWMLLCLFCQCVRAQVTDCEKEMAPSAGEFYPYKQKIFTVFGYPASKTNKSARFDLNLPDERSWKFNHRYKQSYDIVYNGTHLGNKMSLIIDEDMYVSNSSVRVELWSSGCKKDNWLSSWECLKYKPNAKYGEITLHIEIPIWDDEKKITTICNADSPIDLSSFLINKVGYGKIEGASYTINGSSNPDGSMFDPSKYKPGKYTIRATKTYCNSSVFGNSGDFISDDYIITVKGNNIEFPNNTLVLCNNADPVTLLATPSGGVWSNIDDPSDELLPKRRSL